MYTPYDGKFRISNPYNKPNHNGLDMVGYTSKKIYAVAGGVVEIADDKGTLDPNGFGVYVRIAVRDKAKTYDYYGHMVKGSLAVKVGEIVKQGQIIGTEGNTGQSTGNHLHFERRVGGYDRKFAVDSSKVLGIENKEGIYITDNSKQKKASTDKVLVSEAKHEITATKIVKSSELSSAMVSLLSSGFKATSKEITPAEYSFKKSEFKKGDLVTVKSGAKSYDGKLLAFWVTDGKTKFYILEINGDRAVIGNAKGEITSAMNVSNLIKA